MSLKRSITEEAAKAPIALFLNSVMALLAVASLVVSARQGTPPSAASSIARPVATPTMLWPVLSIFASGASSLAFAARFLYGLTPFAGVILSPALAVTALIATSWVARDASFMRDSKSAGAFHDLVFYGTVLIFLAVAGREPLAAFTRAMMAPSPGAKASQSDGLMTLVSALLLIAAWGWIVGLGYGLALNAFF